MKVTLTRIYTCPTYTIGRIRVDNKYVCDSCEDTDRGLDQEMPLEELKRRKVKTKTAIPTGTYRLTLSVQSPKFSRYAYYKKFCNGYLPRLLNVPAFDGILIHKGNRATQSAGCLLVGYNTIKGAVTSSQVAFERLYKILQGATDDITIEITRNYVVK